MSEKFPSGLVERCARALCKVRGVDPDARTGFVQTRNPPRHVTFAEGAESDVEAVLAEAFAWQPMESAPTDETVVLVRHPSPDVDEQVFLASFTMGGWRIHIDLQSVEPTGWMHVPPAGI